VDYFSKYPVLRLALITCLGLGLVGGGIVGLLIHLKPKEVIDMSVDEAKEESFEYRAPNLDVPNPPQDLPYDEFEDFRQREILKANGISLSEAELIVALEQETGVLQAATAHTLGRLSSRGAIEPLKKLLTSSDDLVQVEAAYALARLGVPEGKEGLIRCLGYRLDAYICPAIAAGYLAQLGDPQGFQIIVKSFEVDIPAVRMLACKQLYFFVPFHGAKDKGGNPIDIFRVFERALKDADTNIQWQALVQLRQIRSAETKNILEIYIEQTGDEQLRDVAREIVENNRSFGR